MGKTITVKNATQLAAAIKAATGGETILLRPGDYGDVLIKGKMLTDTVTIKSAYADHESSITGLRIDRSSGFSIENIDVHHILAPGEALTTPAAYVSAAHDIQFVGVEFSGSLDGNAWNDGYGLRISSSSDVSVVDSSFEQLNKGATFANSDGLVIAGNEVSAVREGFQFSNVDNVAIAQNRFTGFTPNLAEGDHSDAVQFLNAGTEGSHHVVIRDNSILVGANGGTQGIFIRAENDASRHSDFTIENNLYNGEARHGIAISGVDGAVVRGNTVTSAVNAKLEAGITYGNNTGLTIDHNIAPLLLDNGGNVGTVLQDNIDLWDPKSNKGIALDQIFDATPQGNAFEAYLLKATGLASGLHAGFTAFDGIGSGHFDLARFAGYGGTDHVLANLVLA